MHKRTLILLLPTLFTLGACPLDPKNIGSPDTTGEPTASATTSPDTAPATETSPDSSSGGATDPGTTATTSTTTSTDTDAATDTSTSSEPVDTEGPEVCPADDPATAAAFKVMLDAWPDQSDDFHHIERACTIDGVNSNGIMVTTALTCDVDGVPRGATVEIAAAPEGEVDWAIGQAVVLHSDVESDEFFSEIYFRLTLADEPTVLLADGRNWWGENVAALLMLGPIRRELTKTCVEEADDKRFELTYSLTRGASVTIMSGNRGALPIDMTHAYAIDLEHSGEDCCHGSEHSLIRRVKL